MYRPPILGLDERCPPIHVQWADGTSLGILSGAFDPKVKAEEARKQELPPNGNVVVLSEWKKRNEKEI